MNKETIEMLYAHILNESKGAEKVRIDLHVHTPASHDFQRGSFPEQDAYLNLLDQALEKKVYILAITDHNTFEGYNHLKKLLEKEEIREKYSEILILCGIEITCFSKHLIAIFPEDFDANKQRSFLEAIGIEESVQGTEDALADNLGPALLIDKVFENGGFAVLAHADSQKGFLQNMCQTSFHGDAFSFSGKSLAKIIKNKGLLAIQCNSSNNALRIKKALNNKDYARNSSSDLAFIKCSDCHGVIESGEYTGVSGHRIGDYFTTVKLSERSFKSLKMVLIDSEMRVCDDDSDEKHAYIEGIAIKSPILSRDGEYAFFHFCDELNCVVGARGTGKTTLLEIIQSIIMPGRFDEEDLNNIFSKYRSAVVFLKNKKSVFAFSSDPKSSYDEYTCTKTYNPNLKVFYKMIQHRGFSVYDGKADEAFLKGFLTAGYKQRQLYNYSRNPKEILTIVDGFLSWKNYKKYNSVCGQITYQRNRLDEILKTIERNRKTAGEEFTTYIDEHGQTKEIAELLFRISNQLIILSQMREEMVEELNHVLVGKVKIKVVYCLSDKEWYQCAKRMASDTTKYTKYSYECILKMEKVFERIIFCSKMARRMDFFKLLLEKNYVQILEIYQLAGHVEKEDLEAIRKILCEEYINIFIENGLELEYNVNSGSPYKAEFRDNRKISLGQNAVALLLLILSASYTMGDPRPLLMDQPEDDLDNSYIYSTLVKEFRKSKQKRQVIISTHNPNIPVAADAENILVLKYNGSHGYLAETGSIDSKSTAEAVLDIMEGGHEAIKKRMDKYNARVF